MIPSLIPNTLYWQEERLFLLDQTKLPLEEKIIEILTSEEVFEALQMLRVRGAPAIGVAGAYGLVIAMKNQQEQKSATFCEELQKQANYLNRARPTAVNLSWALQRVVQRALAVRKQPTAEIYQALLAEAICIHQEDQQLCEGIGETGYSLIRPASGILTHCNAGALATTGIGTALAPLYKAHEQRINFRVYADETRPLLQGSRLTSWELQKAGIEVITICDNMAPFLMQKGDIDLVIVGTDRVAANGDVANKIGTLGVAIAAKHFDIPFYVACPSSTIDLQTLTGDQIVIEERNEQEVTHFGERRTAPENILVRNPAFDVTPHALVTGIITEKSYLSCSL